MMENIVLIIFIAAISASFSYMMDFGFGYPGKQFAEDMNPKALLFRWSFFLAKRRLNKRYVDDQRILINDLQEYKLHIFGLGRELFTWENAFGMCQFCCNFWISLIFAIIFYFTTFQDWILFISTPVFSHFILRKI